MAMVKGLMVEKIEGHINGGNAEVRVCTSLVWIVDVCKCCFNTDSFVLLRKCYTSSKLLYMYKRFT